MMAEAMTEMVAERREGLHRLTQLRARNRREYRAFRKAFDSNLEEFDRGWDEIDRRCPYDPELVPVEE